MDVTVLTMLSPDSSPIVGFILFAAVEFGQLFAKVGENIAQVICKYWIKRYAYAIK